MRAAPSALGVLTKRLQAALAAHDADELTRVAASASAMLPRGRAAEAQAPCVPIADDGGWTFENGIVRARALANGAIVECALVGARSIAAPANTVVAHGGLLRGRAIARGAAAQIADDGLDLHVRAGGARGAIRVELRPNEPFVRVDAAFAGRGEVHLENRFAATRVLACGANGERGALISSDAAALALLSLDPASWIAHELPKGGVRVDLRLGEAARGAAASWAFAPMAADATLGEAQACWQLFAYGARVRLFQSTDYSVLVEDCGPAGDGDGVVVTVRECNGVAGEMRVRCGGRMREAEGAAIEREFLVASIGAGETRAIRVRF